MSKSVYVSAAQANIYLTFTSWHGYYTSPRDQLLEIKLKPCNSLADYRRNLLKTRVLQITVTVEIYRNGFAYTNLQKNVLSINSTPWRIATLLTSKGDTELILI
jgi:hypothetical protein